MSVNATPEWPTLISRLSCSKPHGARSTLWQRALVHRPNLSTWWPNLDERPIQSYPGSIDFDLDMITLGGPLISPM
jgi:hypothetical protein